MSTTTTNLGLFKYDTSKDANVAFSITKALNNNWDIIDAKCGSSNNILDFKWSDHLLNDMSWLRADTFSWQDGTTYSSAYNELLSEYNNSASTTATDGSITYKRTPKGYKIALSNQETAIDTKYATDGIAWYYILDTTNKKFKLPRTKWGFEGLRTSVGDDIAESLPNIKGNITGNTWGWGFSKASGAFIPLKSSANGIAGSGQQRGAYGNVDFNAGKYSSTYQDGAPVQERATQMYLYFYVGNFTKSAEAQTAGLKAELLNGKQDVCIHIIDTYVNGNSGYRIWSDGYCEQWGIAGGTADSYRTITLLKEFKDTSYIILFTETNQTTNDNSRNSTVITNNITTKTFYAYMNRFPFWKACGYLADGEY